MQISAACACRMLLEDKTLTKLRIYSAVDSLYAAVTAAESLKHEPLPSSPYLHEVRQQKEPPILYSPYKQTGKT